MGKGVEAPRPRRRRCRGSRDAIGVKKVGIGEPWTKTDFVAFQALQLSLIHI